jgi:outer membrane protein TolC
MEVTADLGDAMVRLSDAQLALIKNDFDTALAREQLRALLGVELETLTERGAQPEGELP